MFEFRAQPTERKIIVIVDYDTKRKLVLDPQGLEKEMMNSPIMIIEDDELLERDNYPFVVNLKQNGLIEPGKILIQDYYDGDNYFPAAEAKDNTAVAKVMFYQTFFFLLGAKTFKYLELAEISDNSETLTKVEGKASSKVFSANADVEYKKRIENLLKYQLSVESQVREQKCNIDEAENFMYRKRLNNDSFLKNILEDFKYGRDLKQTNVKIRLFQEVNQTTSILGNTGFDTLFSSLKIDAEFKKEITSKSDFLANFIVSWM